VTFLALVAALLFEQARPLAPVNPAHNAYRRFLQFLAAHFEAGNAPQAAFAWLAAVVPPVVLTALIAHWLARWALPLAWLFDVGVLYLTMGFRQFGSRYRETHQALRAADLPRARQALERWYGRELAPLTANEISRLAIERGLVCAHRCVFGVIAWYAVFGAAGAILYRVADIVRAYWTDRFEPVYAPSGRFAREAFGVCDWIPARLTGAAFAIVGDFEDALYCWRTQAAAWPERSEAIVVAAGAGAVGVRLGSPIAALPGIAPRPELGAGEEADPELMTSAIGLVWRALVLWLFVILLLTLAGWLGSAHA